MLSDTEKLAGLPKPNIINLIECDDRKDYTMRELAIRGYPELKFHRFTRYDSDNPIKFIGDPNIISRSALGTASSHLITIKTWFENTDEEYGVFFEDDVDFKTIQWWNFTIMEFLDRMGSKWDALHLCNIYENNPVYAPRRREPWDHGLQAYIIKRSYARKLIKFYWDHNQGPNVIHLKMPLHSAISTENNVLWGFGRIYHFPLFNHNVYDFTSKNIYHYGSLADSCIASYIGIKQWWENEGSKLSLEDIFNYERVKDRTFGEIYT